ncbi:DsrE family protein [Thermus scotoductus]|uniref:DsrE family protein n=1 Tax=Thermus scotoductus TaxID=37636 RepID=UPI0020A607A9|nr:hypothetical protein [Thermus scotoductus]
MVVVYHLDFGDPNRFGQMLTNISNHLSVYDNDPLRPDEFLKWVPSGVGALGELQAKGYAYIKVG